MDFQELDNRRVVVVVNKAGTTWVLTGDAHTEYDEARHRVLRIQLGEDPINVQPTLILDESSWGGRIEVGDADGPVRMIVSLN